MSNKTMGILYGVAAICFAVSCVNYFINGNILKGVLWLGLTAACGFLGYLRLKPQNNEARDNSESTGNSGDPANGESVVSSKESAVAVDEIADGNSSNNEAESR